jgi:hypothetical protein
MVAMIDTYKAVVKKSCPFCGKSTKLVIDDVDNYIDFMHGTSVQDAFPTLSASDREFLLTGMCKKCQEKIFA